MHSHTTDHPTDPVAAVRGPRRDRHLPVVPLVSLAVTVLLQTVQLLVTQIRGARHGMTVTEVLMQWDSQWMTLISRYGYAGFAMGDAGRPGGDPIEWQSVAFFPGYPWAVRLLAAPVRALTGAEVTFTAANVVSAVASFVMVWGLGRLAVDVLWPAALRRMPGCTGDAVGAPGPVVTGVLTAAVGALALGAPMSVVYTMPYSESLYTALAVWALHQLLRGRHLTAGGLVLLAGLTRITAVVLVLTLAVTAVVELCRWWRHRRGGQGTGRDTARVVRACVSPVLGAAGIAGYILWANSRTAEIGGYFAAQERGWHSGVDYGAATWNWLTTQSLDLFPSDSGDGTMPGYAITGWSMILVVALCVVSLYPLLTRRMPWQLWLPAVAVVGMTLGSDGIMHSRPRLLLLPVLFLLLPLVVQWTAAVWRRSSVTPQGRGAEGVTDGGRWPVVVDTVVGVAVGVVWCAVGFTVSGAMLVDFAYAI